MDRRQSTQLCPYHMGNFAVNIKHSIACKHCVIQIPEIDEQSTVGPRRQRRYLNSRMFDELFLKYNTSNNNYTLT